MRSNFTAILDANVLYPAPLRDLLIELAKMGVYRARWTDEITEEWVRNLLAKRDDITRDDLNYTVKMMTEAVSDCRVTEYEGITPSLALTAESDRHVLAAGIKCSAQVIVTYNLSDFPADELAPHDIEAKHPDEFLQDCYDLAPPYVIGGVKNILERLSNPSMTAQELINTYRNKQQLVLTASSLEEVIHLLE